MLWEPLVQAEKSLGFPELGRTWTPTSSLPTSSCSCGSVQKLLRSYFIFPKTDQLVWDKIFSLVTNFASIKCDIFLPSPIYCTTWSRFSGADSHAELLFNLVCFNWRRNSVTSVAFLKQQFKNLERAVYRSANSCLALLRSPFKPQTSFIPLDKSWGIIPRAFINLDHSFPLSSAVCRTGITIDALLSVGQVCLSQSARTAPSKGCPMSGWGFWVHVETRWQIRFAGEVDGTLLAIGQRW